MARKPKRDWDYQSLHEARYYGFFWYDWLWKLLRGVLIFACSLLVVGGLVMTAWNWVDTHYISPMNPDDAELRAFAVESGSSLSKVANDLEDAGLVRNHQVFKYYSDFAGLGQKVQVGEYKLSPAMTIQEIAAQLSQGDGKPITRSITIIPGWTIENIADYFAENGIITDKQAFLSTCKSGQGYSDFYYIGEVLATETATSRLYALEGYLAPNTYEIYTAATVDDILRKLLAQTEASFPSAYFDRMEELGLSMDQVLTLASMIEKEAKTADFAKVSAVFHNRISAKMTLGADVTVKYVLNSAKMALTDSDLSVDSLYNTYKYKGLPVGPICNPSPAAVTAALYPDAEYLALKYLFFCSKDPESGELVFSKTEKEHDAAVALYKPLWVEYDQSRGIQ